MSSPPPNGPVGRRVGRMNTLFSPHTPSKTQDTNDPFLAHFKEFVRALSLEEDTAGCQHDPRKQLQYLTDDDNVARIYTRCTRCGPPNKAKFRYLSGRVGPRERDLIRRMSRITTDLRKAEKASEALQNRQSRALARGKPDSKIDQDLERAADVVRALQAERTGLDEESRVFRQQREEKSLEGPPKPDGQVRRLPHHTLSPSAAATRQPTRDTGVNNLSHAPPLPSASHQLHPPRAPAPTRTHDVGQTEVLGDADSNSDGSESYWKATDDRLPSLLSSMSPDNRPIPIPPSSPVSLVSSSPSRTVARLGRLPRAIAAHNAPVATQTSSSPTTSQKPRGIKRGHTQSDDSDVIDLTLDSDSDADEQRASSHVASRRRLGSRPSPPPQPERQHSLHKAPLPNESDILWVWQYTENGELPEGVVFDKTDRDSFTSICTNWGLKLTDPIAVWMSPEHAWRFMHVENLADIPFCMREDDFIIWVKWGLRDLPMLDVVANDMKLVAPKWPDAESIWQARTESIEEYDKQWRS
ncbi:uncharacterized protein B0H18DRAFT_1118247 [Fomitopsis serialis]|uniref:uncharacterized protein n=1 Tax=Fomitopsis serialis TaxID=139415 RepID=UPI002007A17D|nr:uncharacterized protein B0H18DRAFT_1213679 [Neoantrodia serialis]XP_047894364.1 uncharacterized protein B0H18DRAFT_1118247 [Neoantrodia serialis]KAH9919679.1 hypothetical protein B0H18DRAFT_1213679 [Neoantrodia serialis]KAH9927721.1 hypothetical protein B0H18DRAFT_1118247 [Neoantrodia serialis]